MNSLFSCRLRLFDAVSKLCGKYLTKYSSKFKTKAENISVYKAEETFDILNEHVLSHFLKFVFCKGVIRSAKYWECNLRLTKILLKQGICYSFNLQPKNKIFRENVHYALEDHPNLILPDCKPERQYVTDEVFRCFEDKKTEPYSVKDRRERLHIRTRFYKDFSDSICRPSPAVFIHSPFDIPWDYGSKGYGLDVDEFQRTAFTVSPFVMKTDDNLKKAFSTEERGCYFPDERPLKFFQRYSQSNCELECLTNATSSNPDFNCASFWMPRSNDIEPCQLNTFLTGYEMENIVLNDSCNCLPDCNYVEFRIKKTDSHTTFFDDKIFTKEDYDAVERDGEKKHLKRQFDRRLFMSSNNDFNYEMSIDEAIKAANMTPEFDIWNWKFHEIEVYYEDSKFLAMRRHLTYTFVDFLSQIGGILGCFLGMSILSIIEILYFCTVQMCKKPKVVEENP